MKRLINSLINELINIWPSYSTFVFPTGIHTYIYSYVYIFTCHKCVYAHVCVRHDGCVCMLVCVGVCARAYVCACVCVCVQVYT